MIDESGLYKRMCFQAKEIQNSWIPNEGDFWYCACSNCLTSNKVWLIDHHDVMAIDPKYTLENMKKHYYRTVVDAVMTSRDCGFGQFWLQWKSDETLSHAWLPRFDQLLNIVKAHSDHDYLSEVGMLNQIVQYSTLRNMSIDSNVSLQQVTLQWVMELLYNKRYKENSDQPMIQDDPAEPIEVPENLTEEMILYYKMTRSPRKRCSGGWFEIKTA